MKSVQAFIISFGAVCDRFQAFIISFGAVCDRFSLWAFMRHSDASSFNTKSTGTRIGYTRVSTVAQTLDQQNEALASAGVVKVFSDVMSGVRDDRPGLTAESS